MIATIATQLTNFHLCLISNVKKHNQKFLEECNSCMSKLVKLFYNLKFLNTVIILNYVKKHKLKDNL